MDRAADRLNAAQGSSPADRGALTAAEATQPPSQAEYASIRDALMSTARGRWFLDEFARANRNTDTRTVLDAVERLERAIAAQVLSAPALPAAAEAGEAVTQSLLRENLAALNAALAAREDAAAPARRAVEKLQDVIWTLREGGADLRLCDLLATQADAISASYATLADADAAIATVMDAIGGPGSFGETSRLEECAADLPAEIFASPLNPTPDAEPVAVARPATEPVDNTSRGSSLGDALLASGLVRNTTSDPIGILSRMSQAEKIAFFT